MLSVWGYGGRKKTHGGLFFSQVVVMTAFEYLNTRQTWAVKKPVIVTFVFYIYFIPSEIFYLQQRDESVAQGRRVDRPPSAAFG